MLEIVAVPVGYLQTNCYLIHRENQTLVLDPGAHPNHIKARLAELGWRADKIALTHGHFDHISAVDALEGEKVYISQADFPCLTDPNRNLTNAFIKKVVVRTQGEVLLPGQEFFGFEMIATPGHTEGSICFCDWKERVLFSGDTLFCGGIGRTDLFGGSQERIIESVEKLLGLPGETVVYPGHGEKTTIESERRRMLHS